MPNDGYISLTTVELCISAYMYFSSRIWRWNDPSSYSAWILTTSASRLFSCAIFIWLCASSLVMITFQAGWSPVCTARLPIPVVISLIRVFKMVHQAHDLIVSTKTLKPGLSSIAVPSPSYFAAVFSRRRISRRRISRRCISRRCISPRLCNRAKVSI